ncbi:MAG: 30S ribosomal protein S1 [Deltaproteobacteria bacterium GWC2_42_11]|nr:MAG: 30S ribosomal protein S1 [Deltaproteobacteria bacterium GWC2_42_11]HBO84212.1 30S ribosomal protein S1 [Deltaproteobacteria bacterium]
MTIVDKDISKNQEEEASFANLYESSLKQSIKELEAGKVIKARVVNVSSDTVLVDIGYKSEGRVSSREFIGENGNVAVKIGDEVELLLEKEEDDNGYPVLSKKRLDEIRTWESIENACVKGGIIEGKITNRVKGGFQVKLKGVTAFLPGSQVDIAPVKDYDRFVGKLLDLKVLKFDMEKLNVIVSHRAVLKERTEQERESTLENLEEGKVVEGVVKGITDYGAFIDLGGVDGLLHISDISWSRITNPSQKLSIGDKISVKVLKFNREDGKVSLGLKQLQPEPWTTASEKYPVGSKVKGKVVNIVDYGAFIELEEGVEGLIHISDMSWAKVKHPSQKLKSGDVVETLVLDVDQQNKRISLSLKQMEPNPWDTLEQKYPKGSRVKGIVKNITDFGVFIGVEHGIDGLVHISDISWKKVKHPSNLFKKGEEVEAVVLNIDRENERFSLGIKQLENDSWSEIDKRYSPGMLFKGTVKNITNFGAFVELERGIEGLVHISEIDRSRKKGIDIKVGDEIEIEVLNVDPEEKKMVLSIRRVINPTEKQPPAEPVCRANGTGTEEQT